MAVTTIGGNVLACTVIGVDITPAATATITTAAQTFTVTGVKVGDAILSVNPPSATAGVSVGEAFVSAADTVSVTFINPTAASVTAAAGTYLFTVMRPEGLQAAGAFEQ